MVSEDCSKVFRAFSLISGGAESFNNRVEQESSSLGS
jgi:hypothetical protein